MPLKHQDRGPRDYNIHLLHPHRRHNWEFEIALEGELAPKLGGGRVVPPKAATMWVMPPAVSHGWINPEGVWIQMMVFHFARPPEPLRSYVESREFVGIPLGSDALVRLEEIYNEFLVLSEEPNVTTHLRYEQLYIEFCLMLLDALSFNEPLSSKSIATSRVERAISWYGNNLHHHPSLEDVAEAVSISVPQLRRHFYDTRNENPRSIFQQIRFDRAIELIDQGELSLEAIADACGYGSLSAFSRAWKSHYGASPGASRGISRRRR